MCSKTPPPLGGAYVALFAMCAMRRQATPDAHNGKHRGVCATHENGQCHCAPGVPVFPESHAGANLVRRSSFAGAAKSGMRGKHPQTFWEGKVCATRAQGRSWINIGINGSTVWTITGLALLRKPHWTLWLGKDRSRILFETRSRICLRQPAVDCYS